MYGPRRLSSFRRRYPTLYVPDIRPTNAESTSTRADRPSTRRASPKAEGTPPARNCPAVATDRTRVRASPATRRISRSHRGPGSTARTPVRSGTRSVQRSRVTAVSTLQLGEAADGPRLEAFGDAMDEDGEPEHRQDEVGGEAQLDAEGHAGGCAQGHEEDP